MFPLLLLVTTPIAHALSADVERCAGIDRDADRLACYDAAAGRARPSTPPVEPQTPGREPVSSGGSTTAAALTAPAGATMLEEAWALQADSRRYLIDMYRPNYLLFARWTDNTNMQPSTPGFPPSAAETHLYDSVESKFQISFKARLWSTEDRRWGVWAAYTQQSNWQVYNSSFSRPFRETNYMPELFVTYAPRKKLGDLQWSVLNVGVNHQSNGQSDPLSRSWNRVFAEFGIERGNFALLVQPWYRINEPADRDDNPDITDYYGYGDITAIYKWHDHTFALMGRGNLHTGNGAMQLTWSTPRLLGPLRAYVQLFSGYGESLVDYNWRQTTIGAGIALNDLLPDRK
jgi:phospholipase A1